MWLKQTQQPSSTCAEDILAHLLSSGIDLSIDELIQYQNKASVIN